MSPRNSEQFEQVRKESKTKILMSALDLFAVDGYHNTSISKIAKHAGISKGLMYNYFESKEELLNEVVLMSLEDGMQEMEAMKKQMQEMPAKIILQTMLEMFFAMLEENKIMWKLTLSLAMQVSNMPSIKVSVHQVFNTFLNQMEEILQLNGVQDYKNEAKLLAAHLDGISLHYILFYPDYPVEEIKAQLIEKYCNNEV